MTTEFLDNKICTFKICCRGVSHEKNSVFGRFSSLPPRPPPLKSENFIFIVVSPSLTLGAGSARPNLKMGAPDPENPLFLGFSVLRGGLRPWSRKGPDHGVGVDPETVTNCNSKIATLVPQINRQKLEE